MTLAAVAVASLALTLAAQGQTPAQTTQTTPTVQTTTGTTTDANGNPVQTVSTTTTFHRGKKKDDDADKDKTVTSKDTKKAQANAKKTQKDAHKVDTLAGVDSKKPDKQLFDKAVVAMNKGHYDVARLDLQTMLNTYPDSEYQMRAKLAIADSWYKEGGTAALTQAESEYADFRVFFPNAPEAAEAQMRIGDIYFRQMDRPDRDYAKALHAEEEYRRMLTDYPNSVLVPEAQQRLRDVQEVLATREADIAAYYATRQNFAAAEARYQTVVDTYPLFSHMDDVLVGLGDSYEAQARLVRANASIPDEGMKAKFEQLYDEQAANCYRRVVLEHAASAHVEDAKDRLAAMSLEIPKPTDAQMAASAAVENSRSSYSITDHLGLFFLHKPDTVMASKTGEPSLKDPKATTAPQILKKNNEALTAAFAAGNPGAPAAAPPVAAVVPAPAAVVAPAVPAAPLQFQDVPGSDTPGASGSTIAAPLGNSATTPGTAGMSVEIVHTPAAAPADAGANSLKAVGPPNSAPLPAAETAAAAPDVNNEVNGKTPDAQAANANGKNKKPALDKKDESSSKEKKKTGLGKLNPF